MISLYQLHSWAISYLGELSLSLWIFHDSNLDLVFYRVKICLLFAHKEAFSTLVESLLQMNCIDFTDFLKFAEFIK